MAGFFARIQKFYRMNGGEKLLFRPSVMNAMSNSRP